MMPGVMDEPPLRFSRNMNMLEGQGSAPDIDSDSDTLLLATGPTAEQRRSCPSPGWSCPSPGWSCLSFALKVALNVEIATIIPAHCFNQMKP